MTKEQKEELKQELYNFMIACLEHRGVGTSDEQFEAFDSAFQLWHDTFSESE